MFCINIDTVKVGNKGSAIFFEWTEDRKVKLLTCRVEFKGGNKVERELNN